jgi:hypothetical protein
MRGSVSAQRPPNISTGEYGYEPTHRGVRLQVCQLALVKFYDQRQRGASVLRQTFYGGPVMHREQILMLFGVPFFNFSL